MNLNLTPPSLSNRVGGWVGGKVYRPHMCTTLGIAVYPGAATNAMRFIPASSVGAHNDSDIILLGFL